MNDLTHAILFFFFRLSISSAHAFLLVFSVTDPTSFAAVKQRIEEIREQRKDFQVPPQKLLAKKDEKERKNEKEKERNRGEMLSPFLCHSGLKY